MKRIHTQPLERLLTLSLALAIPLAASPAQAAPWTLVNVSAPGEDADANLTEAQRLYKLGEARYELFDFPAAIEFWTEAYGLLPEGENARVRNVLVRNLSVAHMKAFEVDEDVKHLKTAKMLLERYIQELTTYYSGEADTAGEIDEANKTLAEINAKLDEIEKAEAAAAATTTPDPGPGPGPAPTTGEAPITTSDPGPPPGPEVDDEMMHKGRVMTIVGGAMLGVAAAGGGLATFGAIKGSQANDQAETVDATERPGVLNDGRTGNVLAYVGAGIGAVGLAVGIAMIAVGSKKKKEAQSAALRPTITPTFNRSGAGASLSLEF